MARIRSVKPEFFLDEDIATLPFETRLAYIGLWCEADKEGRLEDRPKRLKATIFPYDDVDMEIQLQSLTIGKQFIIRYEVEDKKYIQIVNFKKHQNPHHTERPSIIPSVNGELTVNDPFIDGEKKDNKIHGKDKDKDSDKDKKKFGSFENVLLTDDEHKKLVTQFGEHGTQDKISRLSEYIASKGKKYSSHYATILTWERKNNPNGTNKTSNKVI